MYYLSKWLQGEPYRSASIRHDAEQKKWVVRLIDGQKYIESASPDSDLGWAIYMTVQIAEDKYGDDRWKEDK